jgi:hypothetical protein
MSRVANALGFIGACILAAFIGVILAAAPFIATLPPCATEDSTNCYWSAETMGNGQGKSFVTFHFAGSDITIYTTGGN